MKELKINVRTWNYKILAVFLIVNSVKFLLPPGANIVLPNTMSIPIINFQVTIDFPAF